MCQMELKIYGCVVCGRTLESSLETSPDSGKENLAPSDLHYLSSLLNIMLPFVLLKAFIAFYLSNGSKHSLVRIMETHCQFYFSMFKLIDLCIEKQHQ